MIMIKVKTSNLKLFCFLFLMSAVFSNAQILEQYPHSQVPYRGGYEGYYSDFHKIVTEKNIAPCANGEEFYQFSILINPDNSVNFIKDYNANNIAKNKCTYDLAREVAQSQKNWNPAVVEGVKKAAVATFMIYPADLFDTYREGYMPAMTFPVFGKFKNNGMEEFRKEIVNRIDTRGFSWVDRFDVIVEFMITKNSAIEDVIIIKSSSSEEFDKRVVYGIQNTKRKWTPATINGKPIDYKYRLTLHAVTDPS